MDTCYGIKWRQQYGVGAYVSFRCVAYLYKNNMVTADTIERSPLALCTAVQVYAQHTLAHKSVIDAHMNEQSKLNTLHSASV